eukprot:7237149-Prymnesium_polylepis.1
MQLRRPPGTGCTARNRSAPPSARAAHRARPRPASHRAAARAPLRGLDHTCDPVSVSCSWRPARPSPVRVPPRTELAAVRERSDALLRNPCCVPPLAHVCAVGREQ